MEDDFNSIIQAGVFVGVENPRINRQGHNIAKRLSNNRADC